MIDEIGGEQLFEHFKVATTLDLFGISTNDCDSRIR
jgi:hypothetical protein